MYSEPAQSLSTETSFAQLVETEDCSKLIIRNKDNVVHCGFELLFARALRICRFAPTLMFFLVLLSASCVTFPAIPSVFISCFRDPSRSLALNGCSCHCGCVDCKIRVNAILEGLCGTIHWITACQWPVCSTVLHPHHWQSRLPVNGVTSVVRGTRLNSLTIEAYNSRGKL